jgi:hypothetical protein
MLTKDTTMKNGNKNGQAAAGAHILRGAAAACPACVSAGLGGWLVFLSARRRRGQQMLEYAIMLGAISAAIMAMFVYSKRGLQAVIKAQADELTGDGEQPAWSDTISSNSSSTTTTDESSDVAIDGMARNYTYQSSSVTTGQEYIVTRQY